MNPVDTSEGIDGLILRTATMVDPSLIPNRRGQRHMEYLPYPDDNFADDEVADPLTERDADSRPLNDVYLRRNRTFIPGQPVEVTHIEAERIYNPVTEFLSPYLYTMTLRHGSRFEWTIHKRYKHLHDLHKDLVHFVESETGRSSSSLVKSQLSDAQSVASKDPSSAKKHDDRPCFPSQNDRIAFINRSSIADRCNTFQDYLNQVLKHPKFREHVSVREFLEVSPLSFVRGLSSSVKEGAISKRSNDDFRGRSIFIRAPFLCDKCKFHHGQKWFVLKDSFLVYINPNSATVGFPMLYDRALTIEDGFRKTGTNNAIRIKNLQRLMIIKFDKEDDRDLWLDYFSQVKLNCSLTAPNPFNSFAPKRQQQYAQWFVNGQSYMAAVAKGILAAKEEIFITDWWLSPEILLVRPCEDGSMRLDNLLGKRAEEGVRVYVMVFKDIVQVVGLNSWHSKIKLTSKSPLKKNIKVIRHPDHRFMPGTESSFLYSHHEKTLVIDQQIAFIGGIDLCWGRWDTDDHRLIDLSDENVTDLKLPDEIAQSPNEEAKKEEAAVDTAERMADNAASSHAGDVKKQNSESSDDPSEGNEEHRSMISKAKDLSEKLLKKNRTANQNQRRTDTYGASVIEDELNSTERKVLAAENQEEEKPHNYSGKSWRKKLRRNRRRGGHEDSSDEEEIEASAQEAVKDEQPETIIGVTPVADKKCRYFLGKDYSNSYEKDFEFIDKFDEDYIDRKCSPRMPWHDEALVVTGHAARDCARHFIQRWNIHKADKYRFNDAFPYILPKTYEDKNIVNVSTLRSIVGDDRAPIEVDAQCVRSCSFWSCGTRTVEHSIQNAYLEMIDKAEHFIYIENQFFISIAEDTTIKNGVGDALYRRILRAHGNKEKFRVYIVVPLLPGFSNANAVQAVLYFITRSINKGETSLYQRLHKAGVSNPEDFVSFYGMRNWDILMGSLVTEIIYVHSKLMIVDDRMCICGSANINDRSLQGSRDSEFCLVVHDTQMVDSQLNGKTQPVGLFSSTWRKKLFRQILGIHNDEINVDDPCSDQFYDYFRQTAKKNALIYEEVFNTLPTDRIKKFVEVEDYVRRPKLKETDPHAAHERCQQIRGFVVEFPLSFLSEDVLMPKWNTSEGMAPILLWT